MLTVLQYLALIAAFFVPWTIGGIVKFQKSGETKKRNICFAALTGCVLIPAAALILAFMIRPV